MSAAEGSSQRTTFMYAQVATRYFSKNMSQRKKVHRDVLDQSLSSVALIMGAKYPAACNKNDESSLL